MGQEKLDGARAAVLIQKLWRGKQARKKYGFQQLSDMELTEYDALLIGNDPKIHGLEPYAAATGRIALIATSGLRSLDIICKLGNKENTPKLIIVDNSNHVISFWRHLRALVEQSHFTDKDSFYQEFDKFLSDHRHLYRNLNDDALFKYNSPDPTGPQYENQNPQKYMEHLVETHGLEYVLSIIKGSAIIAQSWENAQLFTALKNIIEFNEIEKVYAYPSNIEEYVEPWVSLHVTANIERLNPDLTIATNLCPYHRIPEQVFLKPGKPKVNNPILGNNADSSMQEEDSEHTALFQIQDTLAQRIERLRNDAEHNENVLSITVRLSNQLADTITTYIDNKSNTTITKEQATTLFIESSTTVINEAKSSLQKELGWSDFLTNLLKSLANAVITAVNAIGRVFGAESQLPLFKPAPAPFISEVEHVEQDLRELHSIP